jgi:hypothetical protein
LLFICTDLYKDKFVMELGAGAAFPARICAQSATSVITQDRKICYSNHLPTILSEWDKDFALRFRDKFDVILGADLMYDESSFGTLLALISVIINKEKGICILSHEDRNIHHTIVPYLRLFKLRVLSRVPFLDSISPEALVKFLDKNPNLEKAVHAPIFIFTIVHSQYNQASLPPEDEFIL